MKFYGIYTDRNCERLWRIGDNVINVAMLLFVGLTLWSRSFNSFVALLTSYLVMRKPVAVCPSDEYTRHNPIAVMLSVAHSVAAIF